MRHIRIWVYDGILASGVAGSVDVFTAANAVWAETGAERRAKTALKAPLLQWRIAHSETVEALHDFFSLGRVT